MREILFFILIFITGLFLGTLFFGVLWLTVKKAVSSKMPALLFLGSFFFRISITLTGFYFAASGDWKRLVICLAGFVVARFIVMHKTRAIDFKQEQSKKEKDHEA